MQEPRSKEREWLLEVANRLASAIASNSGVFIVSYAEQLVDAMVDEIKARTT